MIENSTFLNSLCSNNSVGIQKIYELVFPKVSKFIIRNKGQLVDAEDIFQKALVQITVRYKREPFEIKSSFEAYLFTACKNLWRRELNKSKNRVTDSGIVELKSEENDMALATLEQERWELFTETLESLSENCKKVLSLFLSKKSHASIAKELGYSSELVVRQRVFKCKSKLAELMKEDKRFNSLREL